MAQSLMFSIAFSSLLSGFFLTPDLSVWAEPNPVLSVWVVLEPSVTIILMELLPSGDAYLLSLLRIGEGATKKSLSDEHMLEARCGNLTPSLPRACN